MQKKKNLSEAASTKASWLEAGFGFKIMFCLYNRPILVQPKPYLGLVHMLWDADSLKLRPDLSLIHRLWGGWEGG